MDAHATSNPAEKPLTHVPMDIYMDLVRKYDNLRKSHQDALARMKKAEAKFRLAKETVKEWQRYVDRHPKQKVALMGAEPQDAASRTPPLNMVLSAHELMQNDLSVSRENSAEDLPTRPPALSDFSPHLELRDVETSNTSPEAVRTSSSKHRNASSQTTEGDPAEHLENVHVKTEAEDDDEPVVVYTKSVKRKRHVQATKPNLLRGTPDRPLNVKEEDSSSPRASRHPVLLRTQTSDLDKLSGCIDTPRKRQKLRNMDQAMLRRCQYPTLPDNASANGEPGSASIIAAREFDSTEENIPPERLRHVKSERVPGAEHSVASQEASSIVSVDENTPRATRKDQRSSSRVQSSSGPLTPLSTNTPTLPRTSTFGAKSAGTKNKSRGAAAISLLSEDGDVHALKAEKATAASDAGKFESRSNRRLENLLEGALSPEPKTYLSPKAPITARKARRSAEPQAALQSMRQPSRTTETLKVATPSTVPRYNLRRSPGPVLPEQEPLRVRPVKRLKLEDFRINPAFQDTDFAYTESVRKREQRRCLPGCTRPECCGSLRRFVELGGVPTTSRPRPLFGSSQSSDGEHGEDDDASDERTLRDYLGPEHARILGNASAAKKQDLLAQARNQQFADQHGKHRQAFERRATPPGFWRTDMPTTQEEEADREEARRMVREKVEERYREAMRGGGRWLFRDE